MNKSIRSLFYLNTGYWLLLGIFEGIGFLPGITLKVARAQGIPEWDPSVLHQYWQYVLHNSIPKYFILWVLGFGIVLIFIKFKDSGNAKLMAGLFVGSLFHAALQALLSQWLDINTGLNLIRLIQADADIIIISISLFNTSISYWLFVVALFALDYFKRYREERIINLELSNSLSQSKLESLMYQLRPHFLFNAMNAISMLVRGNENQKAVEVISDLSDLLRSSLKDEKRDLIPLSDEIAFTKKYLNLEEKLYSENVKITIKIMPEADHVLFPNLLLQPIIENAFKHGFSKITYKGSLMISANLEENNRLKVCITNSGPQLSMSWKLEDHMGIGISNVISRLQNLYGKDFSFSMENSENDKVTITIGIPVI